VSRFKPPDAVHLAVQEARQSQGPAKQRVLFVCIGNCIRSQLAEAFARAYGSDVIEAHSCGLAPAGFIAEPVQRILRERGIALAGQSSKSYHEAGPGPFELIVNISGGPLPRSFPAPAREPVHRDWPVRDPMGQKEEVYEQAAQDIEARVMALVLELRRS
jgi:protein-tyrosine-phosphatase